MKYYLKKPDGHYFSVSEYNCLTKDKTRAAAFKNARDASYWLEYHSLCFVKLKDCGFEIVQEAI